MAYKLYVRMIMYKGSLLLSRAPICIQRSSFLEKAVLFNFRFCVLVVQGRLGFWRQP